VPFGYLKEMMRISVKNSDKSQIHAAQNVEGNRPPTVSARKPKSESNRENAKKSTGPKTMRGKASSRFNALKHGLCAKRVMFSAQDKLLGENLLTLLESLQEQYGKDDVRVQLLCDAVATEYWRQDQGLGFEMKFLKQGDIHFTNQGGMALLNRYLTSSQRALLKNLELLGKVQPQIPAPKQPAAHTGRQRAATPGGGSVLKIVGGRGRSDSPKSKLSIPGSGSAEPAAQNPESSDNPDTEKLS
jgi:hypothetical protein